jgi:putative membrane protein
MMHAWDTGMGALGWTLMVILWLALIVLIGLATARLLPATARSDRDDPSLDRNGARRLLDDRLARGEIDVDAYERLRDALDGSGRGDP